MAFGTLRFGEQGAASLDQQEEARRHAGAQVPGRALQQSRGGFAVSSADGRRGEFGQDGGGDVVVDQVSVLGEGGAELRVRAVVVALGHRRQPQGTAGQDRDGAALQGSTRASARSALPRASAGSPSSASTVASRVRAHASA